MLTADNHIREYYKIEYQREITQRRCQAG